MEWKVEWKVEWDILPASPDTRPARPSLLTFKTRCAGVLPMNSASHPSRFLWLIPLLVLGTGLSALRADVRLPALFSEHLVLQQELPVPVWGWADPGERVTVTFRGRNRSTVTGADGRWAVRLPRQSAGGPFTLVIEGRNRIGLTNVLVGEVWIASGQSNMEWPMHRTFEPDHAIANSANPLIRLFTVPRRRSNEPIHDVEARWVECEPATVRDFSAVAYYFGRSLHEARGVPIGLIHSSWGGSPAEVWIQHELLAAHPEYRRDILDPHPDRARRHQEAVERWEREAAALKAEGKHPDRPRPGNIWTPSELYNGMIAPLIPYAIRGVIWYQGESNAGRAWQYRTLFPDLIRNWRVNWNQGPFPFLAVQLAPWDRNRNRAPEIIASDIGESDWAELREAQSLATRTLPNVGLAVITDFGDKDDIHPAQKQPVGDRLALLARSIAHRERIVANGPTFQRMRIRNDRVLLDFDHVGGGLEARGGPLRGFTIAGPDRKFIPARASIDGRRVVVSSPLVPQPVAVRYGWADYPIVNLFNREGLPATPFRTDDFPLTTAPQPR
jgi:sialate O-acetylesterase